MEIFAFKSNSFNLTINFETDYKIASFFSSVVGYLLEII